MREEILKILDKNSRVSAADIASMLGISEELVQFEIVPKLLSGQ